MSRSVVWFKRDLRVEDHAPLVRAAARGEVIGLYVYEPDVYRAVEHDAAHLVFVNECLGELRRELRARGSELLIAHGEMPDVLDALRPMLRFDELWSHEETGLEATFVRDRRVAAWCRAHDVRWTEVPQHGVVRRLESRDGWADRWRARMSADVELTPDRLRPPPHAVMKELEPGTRRGPRRLRVAPTTITEPQPGGTAHARDLLHSFLHERGEDYQRAMSTPVAGWDGCSRLSPHFAYGTISMRTVYQASRARIAELGRTKENAKWRRSITSFEKRLRWHCHFMQKLEDEPEIQFRNFNRAYDGLRQEDPEKWTEEERRRFEAWRNGTTGYPMVDACMRCLDRTGWINFRMRAMLVSFASYHLWLHWKPVAEHLGTRFLDFEPGIHYAQTQMQSGVTGINTVRIYSPIKQVQDQDPEGVFIRRWVPELIDVPGTRIAQPETMSAAEQKRANCRIGRTYPAPIVDHRTAYAEARRRMYAAKGSAKAREEAAKVYERHGSRRRPASRRGRRAGA